jgi:hypothetical protein
MSEVEWFEYYLDLLYKKRDEDGLFFGLFDETHVWKYNHLLMGKIPIPIIKKYIDKPLDWSNLTFKTDIKDILNNYELPWVWSKLNYSEDNITWELVKENLDKPWDWKTIHKIYGVNLEIIKSLPDKEWDYKEITSQLKYRYYMTNEDILLWSNKDLNWEHLSYNKNLEFETVFILQDKEWDWKTLTTRENNIRFEHIKLLPNKPWDWRFISQNKITYEDYLKNPELPWDKISMLSNPNMTIEQLTSLLYVASNGDVWCEPNIYLLNTLDKEKELFIEKEKNKQK